MMCPSCQWRVGSGSPAAVVVRPSAAGIRTSGDVPTVLVRCPPHPESAAPCIWVHLPDALPGLSQQQDVGQRAALPRVPHTAVSPPHPVPPSTGSPRWGRGSVALRWPRGLAHGVQSLGRSWPWWGWCGGRVDLCAPHVLSPDAVGTPTAPSPGSPALSSGSLPILSPMWEMSGGDRAGVVAAASPTQRGPGAGRGSPHGR